MESSSFPLRLRILPRCIQSTKYLTFGLFLIAIALGGLLFSSWNSLKSCHHKQGIAVMIALISCLFKKKGYIKFINQLLLATFTFCIIQWLNMRGLRASRACLMLDTKTSQLIYGLYFIFFFYYIIVCLMIVCKIVGFGLKSYVNRLLFPHAAAEKTQKAQSIENEEFEALEKVKFLTNDGNNQTSCPICISEFEEQEEMVKLPVCNHCYHEECIQKWLKTHCECPCCRSNIRLNLEAVLKDNEKEDLVTLNIEKESLVVDAESKTMIC